MTSSSLVWNNRPFDQSEANLLATSTLEISSGGTQPQTSLTSSVLAFRVLLRWPAILKTYFWFSPCSPSPTAILQFKLQTSTALGPSQSSSAMDYPLFMVPRYLMGIVILNVLSFICGAILLLVGLFIETNRHFAYDLFSKAFPMSFMAFVLCAAALFLLCMDLTHYRGFFVINSGQVLEIFFIALQNKYRPIFCVWRDRLV